MLANKLLQTWTLRVMHFEINFGMLVKSAENARLESLIKFGKKDNRLFVITCV